MLNAGIKNYMYISVLFEKCKELSTELAFIDEPSTELAFLANERFSEIPAESILDSPESFGLIPPSIIEYTDRGYADVGDKFPNADRKSIMILDPIIKSGTINWLYAKPKVGKTLLGLCIAYAVAIGNRPVGDWKASEPRKVFYIDGEMPGNAIKDHLERIMNGYGDDSREVYSPFRYCNFRELPPQYDSIMDINWQNAYRDRIKWANLVILDTTVRLRE